MQTSIFTPSIEDSINEPIINEQQRRFITSVSRAHAFQLERQGLFPKHLKLGNNANGWKLTEILAWVRSRPIAELKQVGASHD
ncbi:helix-turn-helix transcriptional regulator [Shewanella sp. 30m-9]